MVQEQFFPAFQLFDPKVKHFCQKNTWKKLQMHIQLVKMFWNMKYFWQRICFGKSHSCLHRSNNLFHL